jgi:hypothetical protein
MSHFTVTVCLDDKDGKLAAAARVATEGFPDGKDIPAFGGNEALLLRVIEGRLENALARFDENRECGPYRVYQEGGPENYWLYRSLKEAGESERAGQQEPDEQRVQTAREAALFRSLPEPVTWESLADAVGILYPEDESDRLLISKDGRAYTMSTYNPDSKWDWYAVGGRWAGSFTYRPGFAAEVLNPDRGWVPEAGISQEVTEGAEPLTCDGGRKRALDLAAMRDAAEVTARETHAEWRALTDNLPDALPWQAFADNVSENGYTVQQARAQYHAQPRVKALEGTRFGDPFSSIDAIERYQVPEEAFAERARAAAVPGWAVLTTDGRWMERGRMGWFAVSDATEGSTVGYLEAANAYLDALPDSTWLVTVDAHI